MSFKDWTELAACSRSRTAVVLGSGPSINQLLPKQWKHIAGCDSWAMNNWVYHPSFVPNFYMIETKWYGYNLLKQRIQDKRTQYERVCFLFPKDKMIRMKSGRIRYVRDVVWPDADKYEYRTVSRDPQRSSVVIDANYQYQPNLLTKSYESSITVLLEMLDRLGYRNIVLAGVDLYNSYYFWSDGDPKYGTVHHRTNKEHENKDPNQPHNTIVVKDFIIDFARRFSNRRRHKMCVATTDTILYPHVPLVDWRDV